MVERLEPEGNFVLDKETKSTILLFVRAIKLSRMRNA
jgi:hypothetical protein